MKIAKTFVVKDASYLWKGKSPCNFFLRRRPPRLIL